LLLYDRYGRHAFQVALDFDLPSSILIDLIKYFLPYDGETKETIPHDLHRYAWINLVQKDRNSKLVDKILDKYALISNELANAEDTEGRKAINIASQACQRMIRESIYFCKRYEITTMDAPIHKSHTCVVHVAIDHNNDGDKVALKLMKNFDQFDREVVVRRQARLDPNYVISILRTYNHDEDELFKRDLLRRGFLEYKFCIVMPAAGNLHL